MPPLMWRLRCWAFPQLAYPATLAPRCLFPYVSEAWGGSLRCFGGCGPCRSGKFGSGLSYPFPYSTRYSRARGLVPTRSSYGADHVWTVSDCYDLSGVPKALYTGRRRRLQRTHVSFEIASSWAHLDATCALRCSYALAESEALITTPLAMLPQQRPTAARAGCVAEARSNNE
jgi:hypothetical protein